MHINFTRSNKFSVLKTATILLFLLMGKFSVGQLKIGMSPRTIMPSTVTANSSYSVVVWIKNKGSITYNGKIYLNYGVDSTQTLNSIIITKIDSVIVTNFAPGDSILKAFGETYNNGNAFRYGNGSTVVLWPYIRGNSNSTKDSVKKVVYVNPPLLSGIKELEYLSKLILFPNPNTDGVVYLTTHEEIDLPKKITIYSVFGNYIEELKFNETLNLAHLNAGIYLLNIISKDEKKRKIVKFIKY